MKISEIEDILVNRGATEDLYQLFLTTLKRVPKNMRSQHCYTTAVSLSKKDFEYAIKLMDFSLKNCENSWLDYMRSYLNIALIYENSNQYIDAKENYKKALNSIPIEQRASYCPSISLNILRMELQTNGFSYSNEIRGLYNEINKMDSFALGFRYNLLYKSIAEIIIGMYDNNTDLFRNGINNANSALNISQSTTFDSLLKRKHYKNEAKATKEAIKFLKSIK